jgi:NAD(P)H-dependent FMN reductase
MVHALYLNHPKGDEWFRADKINFMQLNIPVILGSIREGRGSYFPAKLMVEKLEATGAQTQLVDFKELPLPFYDRSKQPSEFNKVYPDPNIQRWSNIAAAADAFVFVVPEYNFGYSGVLKNALDWLYPELRYKAAGLVGVSTGPTGGARAIVQMRNVLSSFNIFDIRETVQFANIQKAFNENGNLLDESYNKKIDGLVKTLMLAAEAMKKLRKN